MVNKSILDIKRIDSEAESWFIEIHYGESDPGTTKMFKDWLAEHIQHQKSYDEFCAFMRETEKYIDSPLCEEKYGHLLPEGFRRRENSAENIIALKKKAVQSARKMVVFGRNHFFGSMAASLFLVLSISFIVQNFLMDEIYHTDVGEQKTVVLTDGSMVKLNTNTKIKVDFSNQDRSVTLDYGQAYFIVAKDKARPFTVYFDNGTVTALGTEFEVYDKGLEVVVSLLEGTVKVRGLSRKAVASGNSAALDQRAEPEEIIMVANIDAKSASQVSLSVDKISTVIKKDNKLIDAWQEKKLIFSKKSLTYVLSEINRYSPQKIILGQPDLGNEVISGIFPTNSEKAIKIIKKYFGFTETINDNDEIVLVRAGQS